MRHAPEEDLTAIPKQTPARPATEEISAAVQALLQGGTIEDLENQSIIRAALACIEHPTDDLETISGHLCDIGMVLAEYGEMENQPPAINAIHCQLFILITQCLIRSIETKLKNATPNFSEIRELIGKAVSYSGVLAKYYNDDTMQTQVLALQEKLESLQS